MKTLQVPLHLVNEPETLHLLGRELSLKDISQNKSTPILPTLTFPWEQSLPETTTQTQFVGNWKS